MVAQSEVLSGWGLDRHVTVGDAGEGGRDAEIMQELLPCVVLADGVVEVVLETTTPRSGLGESANITPEDLRPPARRRAGSSMSSISGQPRLPPAASPPRRAG
jgi:hypothetical protein